MGVTKQVLSQGNGSDKPKAGDNISMVYTGWLEDTSKPENKGKQYVEPRAISFFRADSCRFDSSVGRGDGTFPVRIGTGQVIKGKTCLDASN